MPGGAEVRIRSCRLDECAAVLDVWRRAGALPTVTDDLEAVQHLVADGPGVLLVAERDGAVVGTVIAGWDGWRGWIYRLAVVPDHRRGGVARQLVASAVRWQRDQGARRSAAISHDGEVQAMGFWRSLRDDGWEEAPHTARFVRNS